MKKQVCGLYAINLYSCRKAADAAPADTITKDYVKDDAVRRCEACHGGGCERHFPKNMAYGYIIQAAVSNITEDWIHARKLLYYQAKVDTIRQNLYTNTETADEFS